MRSRRGKARTPGQDPTPRPERSARPSGAAPASAAALTCLALVLCALVAVTTVALPRAGGLSSARDTIEPGRPIRAGDVSQTVSDRGPFVTRSGRSLLLRGATFRFTGFNLYNAAASDIYSCPSTDRLSDDALDDAMRQVRSAGGTVVRFWAFQSYTRGGTDFTGTDRVLAAAREHGLKVFPVLENQWRDCSRPQRGPLSEVQHGTWFTAGYRAALPGQPVSFREYVRRITQHYRDDPTVFAWSLVNEAETVPDDSGAESELVGFARDMADVVHSADPNHLLTLGTQSNGAPGASGRDFRAVYGLPGLDFAEVHDWADRGSDAQPVPGATGSRLPAPGQCEARTAPLACSFALARDMGTPIVVGEAGIAAGGRASRVTRARQIGDKADAAFRAGASGYLVWQLNQRNTDGYGVLVGSGDPLFSSLDAISRARVSPHP